jgi:hypothetical protein
MKSENQSSTDRALPFAIIFVLLALASCHQVSNQQVPVKITSPDTLVFEGTLVKLGPDSGIVSGILAVYRLAKYRVDKVCEGNYERSEIIVDHLIFSGKEFDGIKVNDRVCMTVKISNKILTRYDAEGIRSPSDEVKTFYIATGDIKPISGSQRCCSNQ